MISLFLAKAFGLYLVIVGIPFIFNHRRMQETMVDVVASRGTMLVMAIFTLILGIILVLVHNMWVADWRVIVTLLCWITLLQGIVRFYFPEQMQKWARKFQDKSAFMILGIISVIIGVILLYFGFWGG